MSFPDISADHSISNRAKNSINLSFAVKIDCSEFFEDSVEIDLKNIDIFGEKIERLLPNVAKARKVNEENLKCDCCENSDAKFGFSIDGKQLSALDKLGKFQFASLPEDLIFFFCKGCVSLYVDEETINCIETEFDIQNA